MWVRRVERQVAWRVVGTMGKVFAALLPAGLIAALAGKGGLATALLVVGAACAAVGVVADARVKTFERRAAEEEEARAMVVAERERLSRLSTTKPATGSAFRA